MPDPQVVNIISCGRTGSTLLMGILNSIDGYMVRGENRQMFYKLFEFYRLASGLRTTNPSNHPWFNGHSMDSVRHGVRRLFFDFLDQERTHRVVGFKEVRYAFGDSKHQMGGLGLTPLSEDGEKELYEYLDFLRELTGCKFLYNTRDINAVARSGWWAGSSESASIIKRFEQVMGHYCKTREFCFQISYEDIIAKNLEAMFRFLGEEYDPDWIGKALKVRCYGGQRNRQSTVKTA